MRLLVAIPHFWTKQADARHGSMRGDRAARAAMLTRCLKALHQLFGGSQSVLHLDRPVVSPANQATVGQVDIFVCTVKDQHALADLDVPKKTYRQVISNCPPPILGFQCHAVFRDHLGHYDYFGFMEDDLVLHDPWFFAKLRGFTAQAGAHALLQPNRYEISGETVARKAYVDGDLEPGKTAAFQNIQERPQVLLSFLGTPVVCRRPLNPHAGCFFLNAEQMEYWSKRPYFLDRQCGFFGPLESAATQGIMQTFRVYKPAPPVASFLEVEHCGDALLRTISRRNARLQRNLLAP